LANAAFSAATIGAHRPRQIRLPEHLADFRNSPVGVVRFRRPLVLFGRLALADQVVAEERVQRKAVGELDRRLHHLLEPHRALGLERQRHRVDHRRDRRPERAVAGDVAGILEQRGRRGLGRRTLTVDDDDLFRFGVVDHHGRLAAEAKVRDLADARGEDAGDAGVHRVAAQLQHANARRDGVVPSRRDNPVRAENLRAHRVDWRYRRVRGRLLRDDRDGREHNRGRREAKGHRCLIV
jgi:hypothetical protein